MGGGTPGKAGQPVGVVERLGEAGGVAVLVAVGVDDDDGLRVSVLVAVPGKRQWGWGKGGGSQLTRWTYRLCAIAAGGGKNAQGRQGRFRRNAGESTKRPTYPRTRTPSPAP